MEFQLKHMRLVNIIRRFLPRLSRRLRYEGCGDDFDCGPLPMCWCRNLKIDRATLQVLRTRNRDCVCPRCLQSFPK